MGVRTGEPQTYRLRMRLAKRSVRCTWRETLGRSLLTVQRTEFDTYPRYVANVQARQRSPNPNFLVRISSGGVGVENVKGWGPNSSVCPSKPGKPNFLGGFGRDILPEKFENKSLCLIFSSYMRGWIVFGSGSPPDAPSTVLLPPLRFIKQSDFIRHGKSDASVLAGVHECIHS